jgi:hypothetical protein
MGFQALRGACCGSAEGDFSCRPAVKTTHFDNEHQAVQHSPYPHQKEYLTSSVDRGDMNKCPKRSGSVSGAEGCGEDRVSSY